MFLALKGLEGTFRKGNKKIRWVIKPNGAVSRLWPLFSTVTFADLQYKSCTIFKFCYILNSSEFEMLCFRLLCLCNNVID